VNLIEHRKYSQNNKHVENNKLNSSSRNDYNIIKKFLLYLKCFIPFFVSHHPECNDFKGHTLRWGKVRLCIGCFIGYPTAIMTLLFIRILNMGLFFSSQLFFLISLIFLGTFFLSPLNLTKDKRIKILQKFFLGIGTALLFNWIMERPFTFTINLSTALFVFYIQLIILNLYHVYGILNSCYKCDTPFNWGKCAGFCTIRARMERKSLNNFLLKFEDFSSKLVKRRTMRIKK
jgi:hypothetical protein